MRGSLIDLFPAGEEQALRLDFFGDEIESLRRFDPADQRSTDKADAFTLMPASEALLDEDSIKRFRSRYREQFGATATQDPLYQALSDGRRMAGMEHWLPLLEERLATLFDHLGDDDLVVRDSAADKALEARARGDRGLSRQSRPRDAVASRAAIVRSRPTRSIWRRRNGPSVVAERPIHLASPFPEPESDRIIDFGVEAARDFAPERAQQANVYEAVAEHVGALRKSGHKVVLASYTRGARERLAGLLEDHGLKSAEAGRQLAGSARVPRAQPRCSSCRSTTASPRPTSPCLPSRTCSATGSSAAASKRKAAAAFLEELATLSPGDLVVHADHGIGRYEGLTQIPVGKVPHDCVALEYAGGDKLYVPVENIDMLSRYGSDSEGVTLDSLGGEAWQRRKSRMKERIREIAGELIKAAAMRATRPGVIAEPDSSYPAFVDRFPYEETDDQDRAIDDVLADLEAGKPMDRLVCGDVGFGKTEVALRAAFVAAMPAGRWRWSARRPCSPASIITNFVERLHGFPIKVGRLSRLVPAAEAKKTREGIADGTIDIVIGTHAILAKSIEFKRLGLVIVDEEQHFGVAHKERLKALQSRRPRPHADRDADPAHAADGDGGPARAVGDPDPAGRPPRGADLRHAVGRRRAARGVAARALSRRAELLRRAAHRRPARHRGMAARAGARGEVRHRPRPDERRPRSRSG